MYKVLARPDALRRIETTVLRNQSRVVPFTEETMYLDPVTRNHSISHAGWMTTADGLHAYVYVHIKRSDVEELMTELNLSYEEFYELIKELGFQLSQKHLPWICPKEMHQLSGRRGSYSSRDDFGLTVGDHTDVDVYGNWVS